MRVSPAAFVHVVDPADEVALPTGDVELRDLETSQALRVVITAEVRQGYEERYREFGARVEAQCRANGINYVAAPTSVDPLELLLDMARSATLIGVTRH